MFSTAVPEYEEAAPFPQFPGPKWFLAVYIRDVWSRLPELRAVTSVFGSILKVDSTKKVCVLVAKAIFSFILEHSPLPVYRW